MEEKRPAANIDAKEPSPESSRAERRRKAHELLALQRVQFERLEGDLSQRLQQLAEEIGKQLAADAAVVIESGADAEKAAAAQQARVNELAHLLAARDAELQLARQENERSQIELTRLEAERQKRETLLNELQQQEIRRCSEAARKDAELAEAQAQLAIVQERQQELLRSLEAEKQRSTEKIEATKNQRREIARELKQRRAREMAEIAAQRDELESLRAAALAQDNDAAAAELAAARAGIKKLTAKLDQRVEESAELQAQLDKLTKERESLRVLAESKAASGGADAKEVAKLKTERASLLEKLAAAEAKVKAAEQADGSGAKSNSDLERRLQLAVEELRELKRSNAELESKLAKSRAGGGGPAIPAAGLDWEAQKQRLLASLEAEAPTDDEEVLAERQTIEGTIRITDEVVAKKDEEIRELQRQLQNAGGGDSHANQAAVAEVLDRDETIQQERERLQQIQREWREKIGRAETDLAVERAKLARERAELGEKLQQLEQRPELRSSSAEPAETKPNRGRWLTRLGLKDIDEST